MQKDYRNTETWKKWQGSVLSGTGYHDDRGVKALLILLLSAKSASNLKALCGRNEVPELCRPSLLLRRALKEVWSVMNKNKEEWVIMAVLFHGLDTGPGLSFFYWQQICDSRPIIRFVYPKDPSKPLTFPLCEPGEICFGARVVPEYKRPPAVFLDSAGKRQLVDIDFFYPGRREIFAALAFDQTMFTTNNVAHFLKVMPDFYAVEKNPMENPTIGYQLAISPEEVAEFLELNEFPFPSLRAKSFNHVQPKKGFFKLMEKKLIGELKVPIRDFKTAL